MISWITERTTGAAVVEPKASSPWGSSITAKIT
jgi:hypothetical protein